MEEKRKVKRRIPRAGVVRYFTESSGMGLDSGRGVVVRILPNNAPLRRGYTGIISPPDLLRAAHAILRVEGRKSLKCVLVQDLHLRRKDADAVVSSAMRMTYGARLSSSVDPMW